MKLHGLDHVAINVRDMQRSIEWYRDVLGLEHSAPWGDDPPQMMYAGETAVALFTASVNNPQAFAIDEKRSQITVTHFAFRVDRSGYEAAQTELREKGIEFLERDHSVCLSTYVSDPDGHTIELTTYEIG